LSPDPKEEKCGFLQQSGVKSVHPELPQPSLHVPSFPDTREHKQRGSGPDKDVSDEGLSYGMAEVNM